MDVSRTPSKGCARLTAQSWSSDAVVYPIRGKETAETTMRAHQELPSKGATSTKCRTLRALPNLCRTSKTTQVRHLNSMGSNHLQQRAERCRTFLVTPHMRTRARARTRNFTGREKVRQVRQVRRQPSAPASVGDDCHVVAHVGDCGVVSALDENDPHSASGRPWGETGQFGQAA